MEISFEILAEAIDVVSHVNEIKLVSELIDYLNANRKKVIEVEV